MAKESMKAREVKRAKTVAKYAEKRKALKEAGDYEALQKLPKNASPIRMHNRCKLTGRPKGYMRQFGISRVTFREMANQGLIPGVKKASLSHLEHCWAESSFRQGGSWIQQCSVHPEFREVNQVRRVCEPVAPRDHRRWQPRSGVRV